VYNLQYSKQATRSIKSAYRWYEKENRGLGERFLRSVQTACKSVLRSPGSIRERFPGIYAIRVKSFPYLAYYSILGNTVNILTVYHDSQNPSGLLNILDGE
jgi:plasmid stabilization system protein ParE